MISASEKDKPQSEVSEAINQADHAVLRKIAYGMDLLIPGIYFWLGPPKIAIGGHEPEDEPYRYPGTIHSWAGLAIVLPGYRIWTTYNGRYDP